MDNRLLNSLNPENTFFEEPISKDARQAVESKSKLAIPNRWSVGLGDVEVTRHIPTGPIRTIAVQYDHFGLGGAELVALEQLIILLDLGYRVILYTNAPQADGDLVPPESVKRKCAPSENDDHVERFAFWTHEIEMEGIDMILYNSWVSGWMQFDCWAFSQLKVVFVLYCHNLFTSWFGDETANYLSRALPWAAQHSAAIICTNEASASFFSLYSDRVLLFMNPLRIHMSGVDGTRAPEGKTIVWVGRMTAEKRPDDLVPIMKRVVEVHPDARMIVVGGCTNSEKPQPESIASQAKLSGLDNCMTFTGLTNPYPYLAKASVYLQTSDFEGFSLSLAEAMYFSLPCVTYSCDYLPLVKNNAGVLQTEIGDVNAAAAALCSILGDTKLANEMGRRCRKAYELVASENHSSMYKQLIEGVETDAFPYELAFISKSIPISSRRMCDYFLQGIKRACDERNRLVWGAQAELNHANGRINQLEQEAKALQDEVISIIHSKRYRLGTLISMPYRAALSLWKRKK